MSWPEGVPNPGSQAAQDQGCTCPVLDNCHGRFAPWSPDGWWINEGCPLHDRAMERGYETSEPPGP